MDGDFKLTRERAKELVRDILISDFKQRAPKAVVDEVATKMLKALPPYSELTTPPAKSRPRKPRARKSA
jgi:hypothetical protein